MAELNITKENILEKRRIEVKKIEIKIFDFSCKIATDCKFRSQKLQPFLIMKM